MAAIPAPRPPGRTDMPAATPPSPGSARQLHTLGVLFLVFGALNAVGALAAGGMLAFGILNEAASDFADPAGIGAIVIVGVLVLFALLGAVLGFLAGFGLMRTRRYGLCMAASVLACLSLPLGTVLGIFTLVTLQRADVRAAFAAGDLPR